MPNSRIIDGLIAAKFTASPEAARARLERAQAFLERLFEGPADRHGLADRLHRRSQRRVGSRKFFKSKTRDLRNDIINGRLKARRREPRDIVAQFIESIADG